MCHECLKAKVIYWQINKSRYINKTQIKVCFLKSLPWLVNRNRCLKIISLSIKKNSFSQYCVSKCLVWIRPNYADKYTIRNIKVALPGQIVEDISFYDVWNFCSTLTSVVNVQGDDGHRACKRDETDGHAVIQAWNNVDIFTTGREFAKLLTQIRNIFLNSKVLLQSSY